MTVCRVVFAVLVGFFFSQCGSDNSGEGDFDFVGNPKQKYSASADSIGADRLPPTEQRKPIVVDLIHDLVFRYQRDGWTLTTEPAQVNLEKLQRGGVDLVFSALPMTPGQNPSTALDGAIRSMNELVEDAGGQVELVSSFKEAMASRSRGVVPMMLLLEGADALAGRLDRVAELKRRGLKIVGIVAGRNNAFADTAVFPAEASGLTESGEELLRTCRDLGLVVDATHASPTAFWDVLREQLGAVAVSHTAVRALRDHPRNLNDLQIIALGRYGGLMGLVFNPEFLRGAAQGPVSTADVVAHIMHVKRLGALSALALGTDYNGIRPPRGLEDISRLPALRRALAQQGLTNGEIDGFFGDNARRVLEESERSHGSLRFVEDEILRPIDVDCDVVIGEHEGAAVLACDRYILDKGPILPSQSRHKIRIRDVTRRPAQLELFGEPRTPWQVEGQNLEGKTLFNRIIALDETGRGRLSIPADRNLTRIFCSPSRRSRIREIVVWGH